MNKIEKISYKFSLLFKLLFGLYPIFIIAVWLGAISLPKDFVMARLPVEVNLESIRLTLRLYACLVDMIPTAIVMASFYYLIKLFQLYAKNIVFSYQNVAYIRKISYMLLAHVIAIFLVQPVLSIILTYDAPQGGHIIALGFGSDDLSNLIIGGIAVLISWIMEEGRKLEEETALTV